MRGRPGSDEPCPEFGEARSLLVGGDLRGAEAEALRSHLEECEACSRALADEHWARRALRRSVPEESSPSGHEPLDRDFFGGLQDDILAAVRSEGRAAPRTLAPSAPPRPRRTALLAAALFVAGLAVAQWTVAEPSPVTSLLERQARPMPAVDTAVWDRQNPVRPLGLRPGASGYDAGASCQGLGVRQQAAELVEVEALDPLQDELGVDRR